MRSCLPLVPSYSCLRPLNVADRLLAPVLRQVDGGIDSPCRTANPRLATRRVARLWACVAPKLAPSLPFHLAQRKQKIDVLVRDRLLGHRVVSSAQECANAVA